MLKTCPDPLDIQELQYKLHCRLKVFDNKELSTFPQYHSLVSCASRFGLIFIGTNKNVLQVVQTKELENYTTKDKDVTNYKRRNVPLSSVPKHVSVNCDSTIVAVVLHKDNCPWVVFYDVLSFYTTNVKIINEIRLSSTPDVYIREINWNPSLPEMFTACKSDGTLGIYELKDKSKDINELPSESHSTTFCWSPKGKQIAVGDSEGKITQYKPDLKAVKIISKPPLQGDFMLISLQWVSNYQFIGIYQSKQPGGSASLVVVDAPKTGECTYTNYEDVCYSGSTRSLPQFYSIIQHQWNLLMVASANSTELGVLGNVNGVWRQWIVPDSGRAELPLSTDHQETLPIGMGFDISSTKPLPWGESAIPPCPRLMLFSHQGILCIFHVVNLQQNAVNLCTPPDPINDQSGLALFNVEIEPSINYSQNKVPAPKPLLAQNNLASQNQNKALPNQFVGHITNLPTLNVQPTSTAAFPGLFANIPPAQPLNVTQSNPAPTLFQSTQTTATPAGFGSDGVAGGNVQKVPIVVGVAPKIEAQQKQVVVDNKNMVTKKVETEIDSNISSDTDAMLHQMIREEFVYLEAELKALLHQGRGMNVDLGTELEKTEMVTKIDTLISFVKEIEEICVGQKEEVHYLKQNLVQSWAWFEEAKSRFIASKDENINLLLRSQPLDSAAEKRLKDIHQMEHYIQSQLIQASKALDEQWDNFQDFVKKTYRVQTPTMETIFQTMVRQNAILQKQTYIMKDITMRLRKNARVTGGKSLLLPLDKATAQLTGDLQKMSLTVDDVYERQYAKILNRSKTLTPNKVEKLRNILKNRETPNVTTIKPVSSTIGAYTPKNRTRQMISMLGAQLSPVSKPAVVKSLDFVQSTPLRLDAKTPKTDSVGEIVSAFVPTSSSKQVTLNFTANAPFTFNQNPPKIETSKPFSFAATQQSANFNFSGSTTTTTTTGSSTSLFGTALKISSVTATSTGSSAPFSFVSPVTTALPTAPSISFGSGFKTAPLTMMVKPETVAKKPDVVQSPQAVKDDGNQQQLKFGVIEKEKATSITSSPKPVQQSTADSTTTKPLPMFGLSSSSTTAKASTPLMFGDKPGTTFGDSNKPTPTFGTIPSTTNSTPLFSPTPIIKPVPTSGTTLSLSSSSVPVATDDKSKVAVSVSDPNSIKTSETVAPVTTSPGVQAGTPNTAATSTSSPFSFNKIIIGTSTASQSVFGKPLFGTAASTASATGAGLFSSTTTPSTNSSIFGNATPSVFGTTTSTSGNIFGSTAKSIFGSSGDSSTSVFGGMKTAGSSIFGSSGTTTTTTSSADSTTSNVINSSAGILSSTNTANATTTPATLFGATTTTTASIFGNTASAFGTTSISNTTTAASSGSIFGGTAKTGTMFGNSSTATTSSSIFNTESNAKPSFGSASSTPMFASAPMFSSSTAPATVFGGNTPLATSTTTSAFGSVAPISSAPAVFPASSPSIFANAAASMVSSSAPFGASQNTSSVSSSGIFGQPQQQQQTGGFGGGIFGNAESVFADSSGSGATSTTAASGGIFGSVNSSNMAPATFGTGSVFGSSSATTQQQPISGLNFGSLSVNNATSSGSIFGGQSTTGATQNPFGKTDPKPAPFGSSGGSIFGAPAASTSSSIFGNTNTAPSAFGSSTEGTFGSQTFGSTTNSVFGQTAFGNQVSSSTGPFSSGVGTPVGQTGFGSATAFAKPTPAFGASPTFGGGASGFGATPSFGGSPAFGAAPVFGSSPTKVFGAGTPATAGPQQGGTFGSATTGFDSLANQNNLSFGNLAHQSASTNPTPFSGPASFSSWR